MDDQAHGGTTDPGGVTIVRTAQGVLVARKAAPPGGVARLVREVAVLRLLDGLAVPTPLDPDDDASSGAVELAFAGTATLADSLSRAGLDHGHGSPGRPGPAALLAEVAHIVDLAHQRGVSHGRITADHVLLDGAGTVVLTGWADAGVRSDVAIPIGPAATDSAPFDGPGAFDPATDVAALGELAERAAANEPDNRLRTRLRAVATAACHPEASIRPPMAELARVLALTDDDSRRARRDRSREPSTPAGRARWMVLAAATAATAAVGVVALLAPTGGDAPGAGGRASPGSADERSDGVAGLPHSPSGDVIDPMPSSSVAADGARATASTAPEDSAPTGTDAAPCPTNAAELASGGLPTRCRTVVTITGAFLGVGTDRYALGGPTDQAGLADLRCDGRLSPVVLRLPGGQIYLYDRWPRPGEEVVGRLAGTADGAASLAEAGAARCGAVAITRVDGSVLDITGIVS